MKNIRILPNFGFYFKLIFNNLNTVELRLFELIGAALNSDIGNCFNKNILLL